MNRSGSGGICSLSHFTEEAAIMAQWVFFSLSAFLLWGVWGLLGKISASYLTSRQLLFYTTLGYVTIFPVIGFLSRKEISNVAGAKGIAFAVGAGVCSCAAYICYYLAISRGEASRIVTITALYPVVTVILAFLILREPMSFQKVVGIVLALSGIVLLAQK